MNDEHNNAVPLREFIEAKLDAVALATAIYREADCQRLSRIEDDLKGIRTTLLTITLTIVALILSAIGLVAVLTHKV